MYLQYLLIISPLKGTDPVFESTLKTPAKDTLCKVLLKSVKWLWRDGERIKKFWGGRTADECKKEIAWAR